MLGGGIFITQNKVLPGSYINVISATKATSNVGERGVVALIANLGKSAGKVVEINRADYYKNPENYVDGSNELSSDSHIALREIFCHATKVYAYDTGTSYAPGDAIKALEPYEFNVVCEYSVSNPIITQGIKSWRDDMGKKCQLVTYNNKANHEGIINVVSTAMTKQGGEVSTFALTAWVAGAMAGCAINESCTNMLYDGELEIIVDKTQAELEQCIKNGEVVFHRVYGDIRLLEDINSLTETTDDKGEDFKSNQTIRVVDQIANDIARLFNTKYLGRIPNNGQGRISLWGDIVAHHRQLEEINAIEGFDPSLLTVEQGMNKKSVVINDVVTITNCMAQLYMTVIVQ